MKRDDRMTDFRTTRREALKLAGGAAALGAIAGAVPRRRHKSRGSPDVPRWLREDVGLSPHEESSKYWDHQ